LAYYSKDLICQDIDKPGVCNTFHPLDEDLEKGKKGLTLSKEGLGKEIVSD
jgi:hypothetical protein